MTGIALKSRAETGRPARNMSLCSARAKRSTQNRGMARNERLVSLAGNIFWLTFLPRKIAHFACTEMITFIALASVSCEVCNFARAVACVKIAMLSAVRKLILSPELIS